MARQYTLCRVTRRGLLAVVGLLALTAAARPRAHDIPRDVVVHAVVRPEGQRLRVTLRVPVEALRDIPLPRRPDHALDITAAEPLLRDGVTQWLLPDLELREEGTRLDTPAIAGLSVSSREDLDVALDYAIQSDSSRFAIRPGFERLGVRVITALRFEPPGGVVRAFELRGDPGLVPLDPRWHQAAWRFVKIGFAHILDGADHLLFLLCLVIPLRRLRPLVIVVTAFTAAHSVALAAAAWGFVPGALWFPPLVEMLIAASILYMAIENVVAAAPKRRAAMAFAFGLVHGFGFSFALKETLQFAGSHLLTSLFAFNIGVELGQLLVLLVLVPALAAVFRSGAIGGTRERVTIIVMSVLAGHVAWHWMAERWDALRQFPMPELSAQGALLVLVRILIVVVAGALGFWTWQKLRRAGATSFLQRGKSGEA